MSDCREFCISEDCTGCAEMLINEEKAWPGDGKLLTTAKQYVCLIHSPIVRHLYLRLIDEVEKLTREKKEIRDKMCRLCGIRELDYGARCKGCKWEELEK